MIVQSALDRGGPVLARKLALAGTPAQASLRSSTRKKKYLARRLGGPGRDDRSGVMIRLVVSNFWSYSVVNVCWCRHVGHVHRKFGQVQSVKFSRSCYFGHVKQARLRNIDA